MREIAPKSIVIDRNDKEAIKAYIAQQALIYGVDPEVALAVVRCESNYQYDALGDHGLSRGIWQIFRPAHPDVSDEMAYDIASSTSWAMPLLKKTPEIWSCWKMQHKV